MRKNSNEHSQKQKNMWYAQIKGTYFEHDQ